MGIPSVRQLLDQVTPREMYLLLAAERMGEIGAHRDDLRTAQQTSTLVNMIRAAIGAKGEAVSIAEVSLGDLLARAEAPERTMSPEESLAFARSVFRRGAREKGAEGGTG